MHRVTSVRHLLLLIVLPLFLAGGGQHALAAGRPPRTIACIGNSITFGDGIADRERYSYPAQLQRLLGTHWRVQNFGSSGRTLLKHGDYPYWNEPEFHAAKSLLPDVVIIKLGTNDTKPQNWKYKSEFAGDYEALIREFRSLDSHPKIYLCTPVPAFPGDWGISDSIIRTEMIPLLRDISQRTHCPLIDLYTPLKPHPELFPDKVHPNGDGAALMAREIYSALCRDFGLVKAPEPVEPVPTVRQLMWQELEYCAFLHFGMNTFTDKEWGYGDDAPAIFNPTDFHADSILRTLREAGVRGVVLTCKHHDGFCLWPSNATDYTVAHSPWRNGSGDVVREISDACRDAGLKFGIYLSPWDRHASSYGTPAYLTLYRDQLKELLTSYGHLSEVWFDGANGGDGFYGGTRERRTIDRQTYYQWPETWKMVRSLQPDAVIFSDIGPDIRWVGNENGFAGETCWSPYSPHGEKGDAPAPGYVLAAEGTTGQRDGAQWIPAECDVSIRPGWFYHPAEDTLVKTPGELFDLYCNTVGHNGSLLLNIPPDKRGQLNPSDVRSLRGFKSLLDRTLGRNLSAGASVQASNVRGNDDTFAPSNATDSSEDTYWATDDSARQGSLTMSWTSPVHCSMMMIEEYLPLGQRVESFAVDARQGNTWKQIAGGTTIGHKRIIRFAALATNRLRLRILSSKACPAISFVGVYDAPDAAQPATSPH